MIIIFYGPEGSGKTTQAQKISQAMGLEYISTGLIVREFASANHPEFTTVCRQILHDGIYVDDNNMNKIVSESLKNKNLSLGFILDGYPRTLSQAEFLDNKIKPFKVDHIIYLKLDNKTAITRSLARKRDDFDDEKRITNRLNTYYKDEKNVLDYYQQRAILRTVDSAMSKEQVLSEIKKLLKI